MDSFQQIDRHDSRYGEKQRDIAATVSRMQEVSKKRQADWESQLEDNLMDATMESVLRGGGDRSILHGSDCYRRNFDNWIRSL